MYVVEDKMQHLPDEVITYSEIVTRRGKTKKRRRMFFYRGHVSDWYWDRWKCWHAAMRWYKLKHRSLRQL